MKKRDNMYIMVARAKRRMKYLICLNCGDCGRTFDEQDKKKCVCGAYSCEYNAQEWHIYSGEL